MNQTGYLQSRRASPAGIGAVVALHAALIGAAILAPPEAVPFLKVFKPTQTFVVPPDPAPPPPETPQPRTPSADPPLHVPETVVRTEIARPVPVEVTPLVLPPPPSLPPAIPAVEPIPAARQAPAATPARMDPRFADALQPDYPPAMARLETEGTATVRVLVGTDGRVRQAEAVSATDPAFAKATIAHALRRWRFIPATEDGRAVESWQTITVRFVLD